MAKTYYKVIRHNYHNTSLKSSWHAFTECIYTPNEWVYAPTLANNCKTKLFVFANLDEALRYKQAMIDPRLEIWECNVKNPNRIRICGALNSTDITEYWTLYNKFKKMKKSMEDVRNRIRDRINLADTKAILVDAVKLTNKVA